MEKTKIILRWIFFIPLAIVGAAISAKIIQFLDPYSDTAIGQIWHPIIWNIMFFVISHTIIPSTAEKKSIIPLILLFIINAFGVFMLIFGVFIGAYEPIIKNVWTIIGTIISFCFICYYLFFESGRETIKNIL